jgi:hypothetical protein
VGPSSVPFLALEEKTVNDESVQTLQEARVEDKARLYFCLLTSVQDSDLKMFRTSANAQRHYENT